jgi:Na+-driven multidrug efflux pump
MGVTGAALATSLAALTAMIITLVYFARPNSSSLRLAIPKLRSFKEMGAVCFNGASEMVDSVSGNLTEMVINGQLMRYYGETGVAAMSVFGYIASVFLSISYGFSNAIITIAGYKVGEKKKQEIHELLRRSTVLQMLTGAVMGVLCWLLAKPIATLYVGYDEATLGLAVKVLKISSVACLLYGFDTFCGAFFTGLGDGLGSIIIAFTLSLAAPVGFVLLLPAVWGAEAIWYLYPVFTLATAILCAGMLKWRYPAWMRHLERNGAS